MGAVRNGGKLPRSPHFGATLTRLLCSKPFIHREWGTGKCPLLSWDLVLDTAPEVCSGEGTPYHKEGRRGLSGEAEVGGRRPGGNGGEE